MRQRFAIFFWKFYHLINIKDSRFIKQLFMDKINRVSIVRGAKIDDIYKNKCEDTYCQGLKSIHDKGTLLSYMLLTSKADMDSIHKIVTHGGVVLAEIERMFDKIINNQRANMSSAGINMGTDITPSMLGLIGLTGHPEEGRRDRRQNNDPVYKQMVLEDVYAKLEEDRSYLVSLDKDIINTTKNVYGEVVLNDILMWADQDVLSRYGDIKCRHVNTLTIGRPPISDNEMQNDILDLYSRIAMVLRDILYILDATDTIIKYIASKFHNDEYIYVSKTLSKF